MTYKNNIHINHRNWFFTHTHTHTHTHDPRPTTCTHDPRPLVKLEKFDIFMLARRSINFLYIVKRSEFGKENGAAEDEAQKLFRLNTR